MSGLLQISDPGRRTRAVRLTFNPPIRCPAGQPVYESREGSGCRCPIEENTLTALRDPQSLTAFCFSQYEMCTSWQGQKEWIAEGLRSKQTDDRRGMIDGNKWREEQFEMEREVEVTHFVPED